jgi:uncharacterized membrane protein (DUF4010 family)
MDQETAFVSLGVALGVGLLIGFEREQSAGADKSGGKSMGGVRTYPLVSLGGALATIASREVGAWFVVAAFLAVAALVGVSYADDVRREHEHGLTSEVAMLVTFVLGALAPTEGLIVPQREKVLVLFSVAVVVAIVLSVKPALHALARKATKDDVYATLKFLLAAVVLLPLLPDRTYGPYDVVNPYRIGLLIVLIAGVWFAGYVAVRALGPGRGLGLTGLIGGLVSSTAVTLAASSRAKREPRLAPSCALAVSLANTVMCARVIVVVAAVDADLVPILAAPMACVAATAVVASWIFWRRAQGARGQADELNVVNPFELSSAVKLGLLITVLLFVTKAAAVRIGTGGVYAASVLGGAADVDSVSVSMAQLAQPQIGLHVAAVAILLAVASNTVVKSAIAVLFGGWSFGRSLVAAAAATLAATALGLLFV